MSKQLVPIDEVARRLGKSSQFVRVGLQQGKFPFGVAVSTNGKSYSYHVSPKLFDEYIGKEINTNKVEESEQSD